MTDAGIWSHRGRAVHRSSPVSSEKWDLRAAKIPIAIALFIGSLIWPASLAITVGGLYLPIYRIVVLLLLPFALSEFVRARVKPRLPDYLILAFAVLQAVSLVAQHGLLETIISVNPGGVSKTTALVNSGTTFIECVGPYLLARAYIRNQSSVAATARLLLFVTIGLSVFAVFEALTGYSIFGGVNGFGAVRLGFYRAAGPFPHPILWGVFGASTFAFALAADVLGQSTVKRAGVAALILVAVATSVSSAAFAMVAIQLILLGWFRYTSGLRSRGWFFAAACFALYGFIQIFANRTPLEVLFGYTALNSWTGYYRTLIWRYGWADFLASPLTGIGFHNWARPLWMPSSIDAFWLVILLRYGLLGAGPLVAGIVAAMMRAARALPRPISGARLNLAYFWLVSLASLLISGFTVHFWLQSFVELFFLLGMWEGVASFQRKNPGPLGSAQS